MDMDSVRQAAAGLAGNIETALLVIHDYRASAEAEPGGSFPAAAGDAAALSAFRIADTRYALDTGAAPTYMGSRNLLYQVRFNPARLTLNVSSDSTDIKSSDSDRSRTFAPGDARLSLTATLYFDDMDPQDAFMWDQFTGGLTARSAAGIRKVDRLRKGTAPVHSVRDEVESLISALRNPLTRAVSFRWADFVFTGQLNTVQAQYTMFSPVGRPVRAQALLRIQHEMDPAMLHGWYQDFETAFGARDTRLAERGRAPGDLLNPA